YMDGEMMGRAWFEYAYSLLETGGTLEEGKAAYQQVLDNTAAPRWERVASLGNLAAAHATLAGDWQGAIDLITKVIEMEDPPLDLYVSALNNRGLFYQKLSQWDKALADHELVVQTKNASVEQRVRAVGSQSYV